MVTIADVAARAEVSLGTVSRVLNHNPTVRPAMRKAVLAAIAELGYRPNINARNLRSAKTRVIGLLMGDLTQALSPLAIRGVEAAVQPRGYALLIADGRGDPRVEREALEGLMARRVDGLLWFPVERRAAVEAAVAEVTVPVVLFGQTSPSKAVATAVVDEQSAIESMTADLASLGHHSLGFVGTGLSAQGRLRRLTAACALSGLERDPRFEAVLRSPRGTYDAVRAMLTAHPRPTALLASPHDVVPDTLRAVRDAGLRLGRDLSLVGFGDTDWAAAIDPPLNVITVDFGQHGRDAAEVLLRYASGDESAPHTIHHQSVYIRRGSVGPACP